jgi:23S rRNA-/tRNA-specific pseudouridylate synthase
MRGDGRATKVYDAVVEGDALELSTIEMPLESRGRRVVAVSDDEAAPDLRGRPARTVVRAIRRLGACTLLEVTIGAGYRHQIRAHLAAVGHPIVGDELYGASLPSSLDRPFLHARKVLLESPSTGEQLSIEAPLPQVLAEALGGLERDDEHAEQG